MEKQLIKQVIVDHQKLFSQLNDFVPRDIDLQKYLKSNQIIVVSGIRRSGKSTLLKSFAKMFSKVPVYIKFDDIRFLDFQTSDYQKLEELFEELFGSNIVLYLDEIQEIPQWEKWINTLHAKNNSIFVTGSNSKLLSSEFSTYLTGRHKMLKLFPFSYLELVNYKNLNIHNPSTLEKGKLISLFNDYFDKGGFPDVFLNNDFELLSQYVEDILVKDVIVRHHIKQKKELKDLVLHLLSNVGKTFSYRSLKNITGISSFSTLKNYVDAVCETYLLFLLPKYDSSIKKQLVSSSKVYCNDSGFLNHVAFRFSENNGRTLENIVFLQLKRQGKEIYYYKDKKECDFVIKQGLKIVEAVQVCYNLDDENRKREIEGLVEACKTHKLNKGLLLTYDQEEEFQKDNVKIKVMPVWKWLVLE